MLHKVTISRKKWTRGGKDHPSREGTNRKNLLWFDIGCGCVMGHVLRSYGIGGADLCNNAVPNNSYMRELCYEKNITLNIDSEEINHAIEYNDASYFDDEKRELYIIECLAKINVKVKFVD